MEAKLAAAVTNPSEEGALVAPCCVTLSSLRKDDSLDDPGLPEVPIRGERIRLARGDGRCNESWSLVGAEGRTGGLTPLGIGGDA